jgi:hypothetical protein
VCIGVTVLAGCSSDDVEVAGKDAAIIFGHDHPSVDVQDLKQVAQDWDVSPDSLSKAADKPHEAWGKIEEDLKGANEDIEPARDILIETACDTVQGGDYSETAIQENLEDNIIPSLQLEEQKLLQTAEDLVGSMQQDLQSGSATRAEIALGCAVNSAAGTVNS